ncbi:MULTISPECIES: 2-C-methyl-D-erythritol 4-phosphate cytidylyltransferase [Kocuria]|uniref:2-C-methyl-D-erythritol 4-phosphate cytidylyltransferase n=2 Tax=Kocuria TaxID=57493 RepID=A0A7D7KYG6_KOCVA|nr:MULTISPECIES: 2-C-methyl-D-erythritol 4-phosphate cytidylyltransferase [Kocuria]WNB87922.1 2-C-methyl-D-erythritol 4-phosphate cytidylyltransferase [Glutamicibacter protophormiae]MDN5632516.1 2-C-methyl-D-erythritol 4-phosphate cytidylyltransferase [Kocuria sp.]QMS56510.1 2-C-methyl-D-erythritol 4-phosphate cytidylyltransferase [Kocuria varians]RUP84030.1 2-C-methyl-D-erythritol 4-phosphate cytidylyltransferase [Kocuria sp. HSID17590]RUQ06334.1 2-C-methyl-D-erythritol 4-phosphate cytidylylt
MRHPDVASPSTADGLAVVVVAAGSGTRLGYGMPKALVPVAGRPLLAHALRTVREALPAAAVVVTVPEGDTELSSLARAVGARAVTGGATRAQSVARALAQLPENTEHVLVHDAARCLTPPVVFARVVAALHNEASAVVPVTPVTDTVRGVDEAGASTGTVDRAGLRSVQTPQGFDRALLVRVNAAAGLLPVECEADAASTPGPEGITDDASLVERHAPEHTVYFVEGHEESFKVTRPLDLLLARAVVAARSGVERRE